MKIFLTVIFWIQIISNCTIPQIREGTISNDGVSLYYKTYGTGEPIIALHGGPGFDHQHLLPYVAELSSDFKIIFYDQRGTGLSTSQVDSSSITMDNFILDLEAVRKHFKIDKINLMGFSWGGILAMEYAVRYPQNLKSLVLGCTLASADSFDTFDRKIQNRMPEDTLALNSIRESEEFRNSDPQELEKYYKIFFKSYFADQTLYDKLDLTITDNTATNGNIINELLWQEYMENFDLHPKLSAIQCPTLILHGDKDPIPVGFAKIIHANISNSELHIFKNSGHFIFIESNDEFQTITKTFLHKGLRK